MVRHTMYTIRQAAARTGLGAPLIRAWERRYGVVAPTRTTGGYRLYDDDAIRTLLAMRGLVDAGWTASEAARAIKAGEIAVDDVADEQPAGPARRLLGGTNRARIIERFVAAAESNSPAETEAAIDEILASGSFEAVVDDVLLPAAAAIGESWATGRMSVAAEHAASAAIARRLAAAYQAAGVPGRTTVLVGLPPGSRHELGALAFAVALRRRGVGVMYLGPDVPVDAWVDVARRTKARAAVIGVVTAPTGSLPRPSSKPCGRLDRDRRAGRRGGRRRQPATRTGRSCSRAAWSTRPKSSHRRSAAVPDPARRRCRGRPCACSGRQASGARRLSGAGSGPPAIATTRSHRRRRCAADSRVPGTRSNGRGRRSRNRRPLVEAGSGWRRQPDDRVDPVARASAAAAA